MGFKFKATKRSAVCQIVLGSLCLIFGVFDRIFMFKNDYGYGDDAFHTEGVLAIWMGVWFLITGIIGYYASQPKPHNQEPKKCMINTYLGFSIVATVFAGVLLICYSVGLQYITNGKSCSDKRGRPEYKCQYYPPYRCSYEGRSLEKECRTSVGLGAMIIIFAIAEFGVSILASICCCTGNGCCNDCCRDTPPQQGQVVYLQTQGGPVAAYVMTQGPNGMPVAVPAMTGGPVYQPTNQAMGNQVYMMQNPQGATVTPTQYVQGGQVYLQNPQGATTVIPSQQGVTTSGDQQPSVKTTDASSEPPPVYMP